MAKTHQFANWAEAHQIMGALYKAGKVNTWCPVNSFGKVSANVWTNGRWSKLTEGDFAALVS